MGFREFITNFKYRRRLESYFERLCNIRPPANVSRQHIDRLVEELLEERTAWGARHELEMIGAAAVPSLLAALDDARYHRAEWEKYSQVPAPLESTLELLVSHAAADVVRIASLLVKSPVSEVRKTAALHLASAGQVATMPALRELMRDEDGYVRSYVRIGVDRAATEGRADEAFRQQAYDQLLSQLDQSWGSAMNDAAETIIVLDPARAAVDFADERWLSLGNQNVYRIMEACNSAGIRLPEAAVRRLLDEALPLAVGDRCYPNDYVAAAALRSLAERRVADALALAESLLDHENEKVQTAAANALAVLADVADPTGFVIDRAREVGYEGLTREQRVVFCAFFFDVEVRNGGLMQFFGNSSGNHASDTLDALTELGHAEARTALETAMRLVGPLSKESDRELRLTGFEGRWDELQPAFDGLESAYYAAKKQLRKAWLLYAIRNARHFRR